MAAPWLLTKPDHKLPVLHSVAVETEVLVEAVVEEAADSDAIETADPAINS